MDQGVPVSVRIVEAVAERNAVDPTDLEPRLHDVIDPDALDTLFPSSGGSDSPSATVEFTYAGCSITVDGSGRVDVSGPNTAASARTGCSGELGD